MYKEIIEVEPLDDYKLKLKFSDNLIKYFNLSPYLTLGRFKELRDKNQFKKVKVNFDTIEWENGLDLDPEFIYNNSYF